MKMWQFYILLSAIYITPTLNAEFLLAMGVVCVIIAIISAFKE